MTFWKTFGFHNVSAIDTLLERENFTLEDLLEEEELLSECKAQNQKLLDFILRPETLSNLMDYLSSDPPSNVQKYPYLACEILCMDVWDICEVIYDRPELLTKLWSFLDREPPINPFAVRAASVLMQRKIAESFNFLQTKEGFVESFLSRIGDASITELLMKFISCDEAEGTGIVKWLADQDLIITLVNIFTPKFSADEHENVGQALVDIILSDTQGCHLLVEKLQEKEIFRTLLEHITSSNSKSSVNWGLQVVIEVVKRDCGRAPDTPVPDFIQVCIDFLKPLAEIVSSAPGTRINTSIGEVVPVGIHRLKVVEFFSVLLGQNHEPFDILLLDLEVFNSCFAMFFTNFWNNFLHALVADMVCTFVSNRKPELTLRLLSDCQLLDQICKAVTENEESIAAPKGFSRGHMGFIINISNKLLEVAEVDDSGVIGEVLKNHVGWKEFVDTTLKKHNADALIVLGGPKPSSDDPQSSDEEERIAGEPNGVFSPYLVKQGFTNDFPKDFLADDDEDYEEDGIDDLGNLLVDKAFDKLLGVEPYRTEDSDDDDDAGN